MSFSTNPCTTTAATPLCGLLLLAQFSLTGATVYAQAQPDFTGVWNSSMSHPDDDAWAPADYGCSMGCSKEAYQRLSELLADPANDDKPYEELMGEAWGVGAAALVAIMTEQGLALREEMAHHEAAAIACEPVGLFRMVLTPVPFIIEEHETGLTIRYEEWAALRTVYMDGRGHPADLEPTRYGHSIGHYEGDTLVIETVGMLPSAYRPDNHGGGGHTDQAVFTEHYTRRDDGRRLDLDLTVVDPIMLKAPVVFQKSWLLTPGVELLDHGCESISGQR